MSRPSGNVMTDRGIAFEGIHNFRHFGDYQTHDGARVADGLFRSGQFSRTSKADQIAAP